MNIALWSVQILLAVIYLFAGLMKAARPREQLVERLPWVEDFSLATVRTAGVAELFAAAGLILPGVTGIATFLTPTAATGLSIIMVLAVLIHIRRRELDGTALAVALLAADVLVAWGRFGPYAL